MSVLLLLLLILLLLLLLLLLLFDVDILTAREQKRMIYTCGRSAKAPHPINLCQECSNHYCGEHSRRTKNDIHCHPSIQTTITLT